MDLSMDEERWAVWMVQAQRFADRENYPDAVARIKLVRDDVARALGEVTDARQLERLGRHQARADAQLEAMQTKYDAWRAEIAARRQATIDQAEEEMARPLPVPVD